MLVSCNTFWVVAGETISGHINGDDPVTSRELRRHQVERARVVLEAVNGYPGEVLGGAPDLGCNERLAA